ncbi:MAG: tetratricopeptide repeat protein [Planctomycetes bacterium]|nr:tetratricopeptide repeat protein [Planctomycetota bacterium]NOG54567.1 tetratricopeptide repeat protein [Planctomycetota bacterium]
MSTPRKRPSYRLIILLVFSAISLYTVSNIVDRVMSVAEKAGGGWTPQTVIGALLPGQAGEAVNTLRDTKNLDALLNQVQGNDGTMDSAALAQLSQTLGAGGIPEGDPDHPEAEMVDVRNAPIDPEVEQAIRNSGIALHTQGRLDEAIVAYRRELKAEPKNAATWFNLGIAYFQTEAYEESWDALTTAESLGRLIPPRLKMAVHGKRGTNAAGG